MNEVRCWFGVGRTETGHVRPSNQDAFAVLNDVPLWIVADGMGGHPAGDLASRLAVDFAVQRAPQYLGHVESPEDSCRLLADLLTAANQEILVMAEGQPALKGMGTTVVAMTMTVHPTPAIHIVHLGDSRAYLYRGGKLVQLTRDHTLVEEYVRNGLIDSSEVAHHPQRHVLTQALGIDEEVKPERTSLPLQTDDLVLLCSDGLTKMLGDDDIASILSRAKHDPSMACDRLIEETLARGGEDNVTVIVCASTASNSPPTIDKTISAM